MTNQGVGQCLSHFLRGNIKPISFYHSAYISLLTNSDFHNHGKHVSILCNFQYATNCSFCSLHLEHKTSSPFYIKSKSEKSLSCFLNRLSHHPSSTGSVNRVKFFNANESLSFCVSSSFSSSHNVNEFESDMNNEVIDDAHSEFDSSFKSNSAFDSKSNKKSSHTEPTNVKNPTDLLGCWTDYLFLSDSDLLKQCEMDTYRASGPGGQHRNKTDSAVRLRHKLTGITTQSCEERSQHINRLTALKRLRQNIALKLRSNIQDENFEIPIELVKILPRGNSSKTHSSIQRIGPNHPDFILGAAHLLDLINFFNGSISLAAKKIGISTGIMSKVIISEKLTHQAVNTIRAKFGLKPLK